MNRLIAFLVIFNVWVLTTPALAQESRDRECAEYGAYSDADGIWHNCDADESVLGEDSDGQGMDDVGTEPQYEIEDEQL